MNIFLFLETDVNFYHNSQMTHPQLHFTVYHKQFHFICIIATLVFFFPLFIWLNTM